MSTQHLLSLTYSRSYLLITNLMARLTLTRLLTYRYWLGVYLIRRVAEMDEYERIDAHARRTADAADSLVRVRVRVRAWARIRVRARVRVRSRTEKMPALLAFARSTAAPFRWLWAGSSGGRRRTW